MAAINRHHSWSSVEKQWLRSQIRVRPGRALTFKNKWNHVRTARDTNFSVLSQPGAGFQQAVLEGSALQKPARNWDVQYRMSIEEKTGTILEAANSAWTNAGGNQFPCRGLREISLRAVKKSSDSNRECRQRQATTKQYLEYTKQMRYFLKHRAVVPDDKEKASAWCLPAAAYQLLCILFVLVSDTWSFVEYSRQQANQILIVRVSSILGATLCCRLGISTHSHLLPYVYCSIKSKCFWAGHKAQRICQQLRHSCARKICSYWKWPRRHLWRKVHRCIDLLIKHFSPGAETWGLDDASSRLKTGLQRLRSGTHPCICCRCGLHKDPLNVVVADAGQFYEEVSPGQACAAFTGIVIKATRAGWTHVAVDRGSRKHAFLSARPPPRYNSSFIWFSLQDISCTFFAAMCVSLVSVGHLVASLKGLPIGGLLSRAATSAYLASKEHAWLSSSSVRLEAGFHSIAGFWRNTMLHLRYVDDVLLASRALCRQCLLQVFPPVYSEVSFKVAPPGLSQIWLDMHIDCITGDVFPKPRKPCTPPPWGTSRAYIRPLILGAMLRATAVSTSDSAVRIFMLQFLIGLRQSGWSKRQVCRALYTIHKDHLRSLLVFLRKSVRSEDFSEAVLRQ